MKTYDIKSDKPTVELAKKRLEMIIKYEKEKIIKIIHGYGSSGIGGTIKIAIHQMLKEVLDRQKIKAFIPGEAFGYLLGYDVIIKQYKHLFKDELNKNLANEGTTYIIM